MIFSKVVTRGPEIRIYKIRLRQQFDMDTIAGY